MFEEGKEKEVDVREIAQRSGEVTRLNVLFYAYLINLRFSTKTLR